MIRVVNDETKLMLVLSLRSWYMSVVSKADIGAHCFTKIGFTKKYAVIAVIA